MNSIMYFGKLSPDFQKKKKAMNSNEEKRVRESNCLLFNSQTILPHIAK